MALPLAHLLPKQVRYQAAPRPDSHHYRISGFPLKMQAEVRRNIAKLRISGNQLQHDGVDSLNFDYSQNLKNSCANGKSFSHDRHFADEKRVSRD